VIEIDDKTFEVVIESFCKALYEENGFKIIPFQLDRLKLGLIKPEPIINMTS
jgi:hypothetical protein